MISVAKIDGPLSKGLGSFFSTEAHQDSDRIRYINSAVRAICTAKNFTFNRYSYLLTTQPTQTNYTIPFQVETFAILNEGGDEIEYLDFIDYKLLKDKSEIIGIWDESLVTTMKGTFDILYRGYPPIVTSLNDTIKIPEHFFDILLVKALAYGYADIQQFDKMGVKNDLFDTLIKGMAIRNTNTKPRQSVRMAQEETGGWEV